MTKIKKLKLKSKSENERMNRIILENMVYAENIFRISFGLMFASRRKVHNGMCLVMPFKVRDKLSKKSRFNSSITMLFCFVDMEILFLDEEFKVVDKVILKKWILSYTPKMPAKYVIESIVGRFKDVNIGDMLEIV